MGVRVIGREFENPIPLLTSPLKGEERSFTLHSKGSTPWITICRSLTCFTASGNPLCFT